MKQLSETLDPDTKDLRVFAVLQFAFFSLISLLLVRKGIGSQLTLSVIGLSLIVAMAGLLRPILIRYLYIVWMVAVFPIGWFVSHFLMAVVYYFVVTPIGIWRSRTSGDPLQRKFDPELESYWEERNASPNPDSYFRQF